MPQAPGIRHVFTLNVDIAKPVNIGNTPHGRRRVIPITGGTFTGPAAAGQVLSGGADWNLGREDGSGHLWARYTLLTDDGSHLMVTNEGWRAPDDGSPEGWYCRTNPRFEAGEGPYAWMNHTLFIGDLHRPSAGDGHVVIDVYRVT